MALSKDDILECNRRDERNGIVELIEAMEEKFGVTAAAAVAAAPAAAGGTRCALLKSRLSLTYADLSW